MDKLRHDIRIAIRRLFRHKIYSTVIVLSLALGIGANTAIFSVVNTLLLRPLPIKDVDRVGFTLDVRGGNDPYWVAILGAMALRNEARFFESMGMGRAGVFRWSNRERPELIKCAQVTSDYLSTLGVEPVVGRRFAPADDSPGAAPVALISNSLWQTHFGSDPGVLGAALTLDNRPYTVIGIMPPAFDFPDQTKVWMPFATDFEALPPDRKAVHNNSVVVRFRPGVSIEEANAEAREIGLRLEEAYPQHRKGWGIKLIPIRQLLISDLGGNIRPALFLLMAIVGFLLLIACANVASLLLARSLERTHETAIQASLGASRGRLISQLLTESIILSLIGGAAGLLLARSAASSLMALRPINFFTMSEVLQSVPIDARVLGFTFIVSLLTGVIFALAPAARTSISGNLVDQLKQGGQRTGGGVGSRRLFDALLIGEIAVAMILLIGAALMVRSFQLLSNAELGFRPDHLFAVEMSMGESDYPGQEHRTQFMKQVMEKVRNLPGVTSAGFSTTFPLAPVSHDSSYVVEGRAPVSGAETMYTGHRLVTPEYLETLGVKRIAGRLIEEHDQAHTTPVVVVTKEFAGRAWPGEDPIGKRVARGSPPSSDAPWYTVVGVVDDIKEDRFDFRIDRPAWYIPYTQLEVARPAAQVERDRGLPVSLVVRTSSDPSALLGPVRGAISSVNQNQAVADPIIVDKMIEEFLGPQRFTAALSGLFAGLGLFLAVVGIYGVTAYSVAQRTREFSIRMAFGAQRGDVMRLVLRRGLILALLGIVIGVLFGFVLGGVLSSLLYQVRPGSPEAFAGPVVILLVVVVAAMYLPLRRIMRLDPVVGLRQE